MSAYGFVGELNDQQRTVLAQLKEKLATDLDKEMTECAKKWLFDARILCYLRAKKFDLDNSFEMIVNMLKFRMGFQQIGVDALKTTMCENEFKTGKSYHHGCDKQGGPICYIKSALHDPYKTDPLENQRFTILLMEYGARLAQSGQTTTIVFDMSNWTMRNIDLKATNFMVTALQCYYPFGVGKVLVYNATWIVNGVWKIIRPWLDPLAQEMVIFTDDLTQFIPVENLMVEYGGTDSYEHNYTTYQSLVATALESEAATPLPAS
jgi:hypothetical protein